MEDKVSLSWTGSEWGHGLWLNSACFIGHEGKFNLKYSWMPGFSRWWSTSFVADCIFCSRHFNRIRKTPEFNWFQSLLGLAWGFLFLIVYITYVSMLYFLPPQQIKGSVPLIPQYVMVPKICLWSLLCCLHKSTYNSSEREIANLVPSWFSFLMINGVSPSKWCESKKIRLVL